MDKPTRPALSSSDIRRFDLIPQPILVCEQDDLRVTTLNAAAEALPGAERRHHGALTLKDLFPGLEHALLARALSGSAPVALDMPATTRPKGDDALPDATLHCQPILYDAAKAILITVMPARPAAGTSRPNSSAQAGTGSGLSRQALADLFDAMPGKMVVIRPVTHEIVAVSDEYAAAVMRERVEMIGRSLFDVIPDDPEYADADGTQNLRASLQRVQTLGLTDVMDLQRFSIRQRDGVFQERYWLPCNKPVFDAAGEMAYIVHRVEDATDILKPTATGDEARRQIDESQSAYLALLDRQKRLATAERLLDLGSWEFDISRRTFFWSARTRALFGWDDEHRTPSFDDYMALVHPDDRARIADASAALASSDRTEGSFEHRILRPDGDILHVRGVCRRHNVDGRDLLIGFVQDITPYRLAEQEITKSLRRRRLAGQLARLGTWSLDVATQEVTWSEKAAEIHGWTSDRQPVLDDMLANYLPEHRNALRAALDSCIETGKPVFETLQLQTRGDRTIWVRKIGEPVRDDAGRTVAIDGALQDITDLVSARETAENLAVRLSNTLESITDAFVLLGHDWEILFANGKTEEIWGQQRAKLIGRSMWDVFPNGKGNAFFRHYEQAIREQRSLRFEEYSDALGKWLDVDAHPTPEGLAIYFRDVTETRARAQHLRLLEAAISRLNDILIITEAEPVDAPHGPRIVYVNDSFEKRTGYTRDEVIGRTPRFLQGPRTQRDELDRIGQSLRKWRPVRAELINYSKSGEEFWIELDIVPIADESGWYTHWVSIERDVTKRKISEEAIRASEERFRLMARAAGNAIWEWDILRNRDWWSDGLATFFGHQPDPADSAPAVWAKHVHPDDKERVDAALQDMINGRDDMMHVQYRFRRSDGTWAFVEDHAFAIRNAEGKAVRVLGSLRDISEHKQLEERLRQSQKMELVGQLTGGVAHDFNNLLTVILGNAEILAEDLEDVPQLQRLAQLTVSAAEKGAELTSRLLAFSRKQHLDPQVVDVLELVRGMDGLLRRTLPASIDLSIIGAPDLWTIDVDPTQLESALLNLSINARDAMPDGGHLTFEMANTELDANYVALEPGVEPGQYVMISVSDTGTGIPRENLGRIFEPFFTTKEVGKGSGLGLSMVFGFVKQSGGHIQVYSEMGVGTTLRLYLPRARTQSREAHPAQPRRAMEGGRETILVVEDDALVRSHVASQIEALGYRVIEAAHGAQALDILRRDTSIDLVFTDVIMPGGMSGRDVANAARALRPELKILFTSGYTENIVLQTGRMEQGVHLLSKPYRRDQLASKLRDVLDTALPDA